MLEEIPWQVLWNTWGRSFVINILSGLSVAALLYAGAKVALRKRSLQVRFFRLLGIDDLQESYRVATDNLDLVRKDLGAIVKRLARRNSDVRKEELQETVYTAYDAIYAAHSSLRENQAHLDGMLKADEVLDNHEKAARQS